jgi:hypothetical protein
MTGGPPSDDGAAMVFGAAGSSGCRRDAAGGASFGTLLAVEGAGDAFRLGASVSSGESPVWPGAGAATTACDGEGPSDEGTREGMASVAGIKAPADGDQT